MANDNNPYAAPQSQVDNADIQMMQKTEGLASRWARLGAAIIDGVIQMLIALPILFALGFFAIIDPSWTLGFSIFDPLYNANNFVIEVVSGLFGFVIGYAVYFLVQSRQLKQTSQTIGKRALDIVITDMNGKPADFNNIMYKRELFYYGIAAIPFIGQWIAVADIVMIFGQEKRCLHDRVADTQVMNVKASEIA